MAAEILCSFKGCARPAVYTQHCGDRSLCRKHFLQSVERRVARTVRRFGLLEKGDSIAAAVSGGKDSVSLLHLLKPLCDSMRIPLIAILVDEGITGYRDGARKVAEENCKTLGVPLHVRSFKEEAGFSMDEIAGKKGRGKACSYCGVFRRWILNRAARELGANKLATGHNLDDLAQTVLMNIMRNEPSRLARFGPNGGVAEDERFVRRIKPLNGIPEREVALYAVLMEEGIEFGECPYAGEAFRGGVRDFLNETEEEYPGTKAGIGNSFESIRGLLADAFAKVEKPRRCKECGEPSSSEICKACGMRRELEGLEVG